MFDLLPGSTNVTRIRDGETKFSCSRKAIRLDYRHPAVIRLAPCGNPQRLRERIEVVKSVSYVSVVRFFRYVFPGVALTSYHCL